MARHWTLLRLGLPKVLGIFLFLALTLHGVAAFSATPPATASVNLEWSPSSDPAVIGYNIYYGGVSGNYTNKINAGNVTNINIFGLVPGVTYYFAATAYDALGDESGFSSEISYLVPANLPGVQIRSGLAGQFILTVSGTAGLTFDVQASPDLSAWTVIGTVTLDASGSMDFTDPDAANFPQRFYRTQATP
jgi:hypothetical protein